MTAPVVRIDRERPWAREYSRPDACGNGIDVPANAVLALAGPVA